MRTCKRKLPRSSESTRPARSEFGWLMSSLLRPDSSKLPGLPIVVRMSCRYSGSLDHTDAVGVGSQGPDVNDDGFAEASQGWD
jgi:hypothetical protein